MRSHHTLGHWIKGALHLSVWQSAAFFSPWRITATVTGQGWTLADPNAYPSRYEDVPQCAVYLPPYKCRHFPSGRPSDPAISRQLNKLLGFL